MVACLRISLLLIVAVGQVQSVKVCFSSKDSNPKDAEGKITKKAINVFIKAGDCKPLGFASTSEFFGYSCLGNRKEFALGIPYSHHEILKPAIHTTTNFEVYQELNTDTSEIDYPNDMNICLTWGTWSPQASDPTRRVYDIYLNFITDPKLKLEHLIFFDVLVDIQKIDLYVAEKKMPEVKKDEHVALRGALFLYGDPTFGNRVFKTKFGEKRFQMVIGNMDIQRNCYGRLYFVFPLGSGEKDLIKKGMESSLTQEEISTPDVWKNIEFQTINMLGIKFQRKKDPEITFLENLRI